MINIQDGAKFDPLWALSFMFVWFLTASWSSIPSPFAMQRYLFLDAGNQINCERSLLVNLITYSCCTNSAVYKYSEFLSLNDGQFMLTFVLIFVILVVLCLLLMINLCPTRPAGEVI